MSMDLGDFKKSLASSTPPPGLSVELQALWCDAKGEWDRAHGLVQDLESDAAAWVHAYLHRKEGDVSNAGYWYRRAQKPTPGTSLDSEWDAVVATLLREP
jgi:hypothetical protein